MASTDTTLAALLRIPSATAVDASAGVVLVAANDSGIDQLYRVPLQGGIPLRLTDLPEPVDGRFVAGGERVVVSMDHGGDERHQLYLLDAPLDEPRALVVDHDHIHRLGGVTRDGHRFLYATNRRNGVDFDVVVHDLRDGSERVLFDRGGWCDAGGFSPDGRWAVVTRLADRSMDNDLFLVDVDTGEVLHASPHDDDATFHEPAWLGDSSAFICATDTGRDTMALRRCDMATRHWKDVLDVGSECACWTDDSGARLLLAVNEDGRSRLEVRDATTLEHIAGVPLPEPGVAWRHHLMPSPRFAAGGSTVVCSFASPRRPAGVWADGTCLIDTKRDIPPEDCVTPETVTIPSFDGERIPAFVYRPTPQSHTAPSPVVVYVHGGPESQTTLMWDPLIQALVGRGYAVVAPNVRGSTGYGKRYAHLDDVRLRLNSVRDLAAVHAWLPSAGLDATRAALWGGSYGGYMVLAGLAFEPELWAAGVDFVGLSSLVTFLENTSAWRRATREREYGSLERDRDFLIEASPLTHVDRMRAPLFIVHGANDPRVPLSEAQQMHARLRANGVDTELLVFSDEGHRMRRLENRLDAYTRAVAFLDRVL